MKTIVNKKRPEFRSSFSAMATAVSIALFVSFSSSCSHPSPPTESYSTFIQNVIDTNETWLIDYKTHHEANWGNNWKLMSAVIDPHEQTIEIKSDTGVITRVEPDTGCILEWNQNLGDHGTIRREVYDNISKKPSVECFYYRNDSVYAKGSIEFISDKRKEKLLITQNVWPAYPCTGCANKSYADVQRDIAADTLSHPTSGYVCEFYDSTGQVDGRYTSPQYITWTYQYTDDGPSFVYLVGGSTISTEKKASHVVVELE